MTDFMMKAEMEATATPETIGGSDKDQHSWPYLCERFFVPDEVTLMLSQSY